MSADFCRFDPNFRLNFPVASSRKLAYFNILEINFICKIALLQNAIRQWYRYLAVGNDPVIRLRWTARGPRLR